MRSFARVVVSAQLRARLELCFNTGSHKSRSWQKLKECFVSNEAEIRQELMEVSFE